MEYYRFKLVPANRASVVNYGQIENSTRLFSKAATNVSMGATFLRKGKRIAIEQIRDQTIILTLSSIMPLKRASRSLYAFSRELLRLDEGVLEDSIFNHSLFSVQPLENLNMAPALQLSDTQLIKAVIDLLFSNSLAYTQDPNRDKTIAQLKELLLPYVINDTALSKSKTSDTEN